MLTPEKLKDARKDLNISQRELGKQVGIHPTDISRFECNRYQLTPKQCRLVWDYLTKHLEHLREEEEPDFENVELDISAPMEINGIMIPEGFDLEQAESLMQRHQTNLEEIRAVLDADLERGFLGGIKMDALIHNVLVPIIDNHAIIEQIHGHPGIEPRTLDLEEPMEDLPDIKTNRDALAYLVGRAQYLKYLEEDDAA